MSVLSTAGAILHPDDLVDVDESLIGGKAVGLVRLHSSGVQGAPFFVITCRPFRRHLETGAVPAALGRALLAQHEAREEDPISIVRCGSWLRSAVESEPLDAGLCEEITVAVAELGPGPFAVRSSMVGEDSAKHSFAGQLDSYLYQETAQDVLDGVLHCWGSAFGERALAYATRVGVTLTAISMGVVVQQMVDADVSGVAFTSNPLTGRRDQCLVTAAYGVGEGVVSGICDTDEYTWSRLGGESFVQLAEKDKLVRRAANGSGTEEGMVRQNLRGTRALSERQVDEICVMASRIAEVADMAMDVEWAYSAGHLYVLQARPITSMRAVPDPDGESLIFDNSNIQESYCGVTTPLTFSFASNAYERTFLQFIKALGASDRVLADFEPVARNLLSLIEGRVYYNLYSWYRMLQIFPGFKRKKEDTEKNWQVGKSAEVQAESGSVRDRTRRRIEQTRIGIGLAWRYLRLKRDAQRFIAHFNHVYARVNRDTLRNLSLARLVSLGEWLNKELLDHWEIPNINDFRVMMSSGRLRRILARYYGDEAEARLADLLSGIDGIESIRPTQILMQIALTARADPQIAAALVDGNSATALTNLRSEFPEFTTRIDQYIDRYGDRCIGELKLETTSTREDPSFVIEVLRRYLEMPMIAVDELVQREAERFDAAYRQLRSELGPIGRMTLRHRVAAARNAVKTRETLRLLRTLAFGIARDIFRAMGHRLHEAGILDDPRDVLYLTVDELTAFEEGRAVSVSLTSIAAARKAEYARYEQDEPPNRVETVGSPYLADDYHEPIESGAEDSTTDTLQGLGCCAGVVEADVALIFDLSAGLPVNGRILCTARTDPGWAPLFPVARGLIVERGSALSHSAVIARELGLPTVVGVKDVTRILVDGQLVRLDGKRGTVERLARANTHASDRRSPGEAMSYPRSLTEQQDDR